MNRSVWKNWERFWAEKLRGKRIPVTGRSGKDGDVPDVETPLFACEVKAGAVVSSRTLKAVSQSRAAGERTHKIPLVCQTHKVNKTTAVHLVTMELDVFLKLFSKKMEKADQEEKEKIELQKKLTI